MERAFFAQSSVVIDIDRVDSFTGLRKAVGLLSGLLTVEGRNKLDSGFIMFCETVAFPVCASGR